MRLLNTLKNLTHRLKEVMNIVDTKRIKWESLILEQTVTATGATYNTYNGRKISDYDILCFIASTDSNYYRENKMLPTTLWSSGKQVGFGILHGTSSSSASAFSVSWANFIYVSDTQIRMNVASSGAINKLQVVGAKLSN